MKHHGTVTLSENADGSVAFRLGREMKPQATRYTQKQLAYLAYWEQRGFTFRRGAQVPETVEAPPSFATRHPIADAIIGSLLLAVFIGAAVSGWIAIGAGWTP